MAAEFNRAIARFIATCAYVTAVHDLITKWRLELVGGYILDLYFNETLGKYGYTLVQAGQAHIGVGQRAPSSWSCQLPSPCAPTGRTN